MFRKLTAIEIAEGALLADIAIAFELLSIYLPYLAPFFRILIPIVFAVLALRHGVYVGLMALSVAIFVVGVMTGPHFLLSLVMMAALGLFMGTAMRRRVPHLAVLLVGVTASALVLWSLVFLLAWLVGLPIDDIVLMLQRGYALALATADFLASQVGLGDWWRDTAYPAVDPLARLALAHWWAPYLALLWTLMWPVVVVTYATANSFVRQMGYEVEPFPSRGLSRIVWRVSRAMDVNRWWRRLVGRRFTRGRQAAS